MIKLLEYLARELTGDDSITVEAVREGETDVYTINAPQPVMGLLIGREGKTIRAIRAVAKARAIVDQASVAVKLQEIPASV